MFTDNALNSVANGISEAKRGNTSRGYTLLEEALKGSCRPEVKAWLGYCMAREGGDFDKAHRLCREALKQNPVDSDLYLALGRLYLVAGRRKPAVYTLEKGLEKERNLEICKLLQSIGTRKAQPFSFLPRNHFVNVTFGQLLTRIGLR